MGTKKYAELLDEMDVIGQLWACLLRMPLGHSRGELFACNLTNLCSFRSRHDTREAYVYLVVFDRRYRHLSYKAESARYSLQDDPDCAHLRSVLEGDPITQEDIRRCRKSLR